ncbi:hypothetical protein E2542_SST17691 [Spatholobus suberectus]|nr:hypothetical protein E2542_SST17691 [Spatholobus suberectus]
MDSVPVSSRLKGVATTHVQSSKPTSIVALPVPVGLLITPNSSRIGAPMLTVTPRMMQQARLHARVGLTIGLSFALEPNPLLLFLLLRGSE